MVEDPKAAYPIGDLVNPISEAWLAVSRNALGNVLATQKAVLTSAGLLADGHEEPVAGSVTYADSSWSVRRDLDDVDRISVGDSITFGKRISQQEVDAFARLSGDTNRLHLDPDFAADTRFGGPIVHGSLGAGLISAALARFPGVVIYLSQDLSFQKPVEIGDHLSAVCEILEEVGEQTFRVSTKVLDQDEDVAISGEAMILVDPLPDE